MFKKVAWACSEEERLRIRLEKEAPITDRLNDKINEKLIDGKILPKSKFKETLENFCGLIPHIAEFGPFHFFHF